MSPSPDFQKKRGPNPSERRDPQLVAVTPRHILVVTVLVLVPFFSGGPPRSNCNRFAALEATPARAIGVFIAYTTLHLGDVLGRARFLCFPVARIASTASKIPSATSVGLCLSSLWRFSRVSRTKLWNAKVSRSFGAYPLHVYDDFGHKSQIPCVFLTVNTIRIFVSFSKCAAQRGLHGGPLFAVTDVLVNFAHAHPPSTVWVSWSRIAALRSF